jgi:DNA-binding transcriptional ArsR family regulator
MKYHALSPSPHLRDLTTVLETFKSLSEPVRIQLVLLLHEGEKSVGELVGELELPQSTVSRHLAILRSSHLVVTRREGTHIYYALRSSHVGDLVAQAFAHTEHERRSLPDHPTEARAKVQRSKQSSRRSVVSR